MKRHIVLIGLPGAGKTTVGRLVAEQLQTGFVDVDAAIVRKMGMPVTQIFGQFGEAKFREVEREITEGAIQGPPCVISPGGGWAAQEGAIEAAKAGSFIIYVKVSAMTAAKRAVGEDTRPLLAGQDPNEQMRALLKEREPHYLKADAEVKADTTGAVGVASEIVALARQRAGW